jgi:uncharacterized protein YndB with AHSA1/START domain
MKKKLHFETLIDAPQRVVWDTMLEPETYQRWTAEFMEGSYYEGSWEEGEDILFLAPDGNGMKAVIEESRPHEFVSIKHLGFIKDGVEDIESLEARNWAPAYENYTLSESGGSTKVEVDLDVTPEYEQMMEEIWPKALEKLKEISEGEGA